MNDHQRRLLRSSIGLRGPIEPSETDWHRWFEAAVSGRVVPLLYDVVESACPSLAEPVRLGALELQLEVMAAMVRFECDLLEIVQHLEILEIRYAVLKGFATAHLDYARPELRQAGDLDLLVAATDLERVEKYLGQLGWTQAYSLPRHHRAFTHALSLRNERRVEVDLHQRIAHRALGRVIPAEQLLDRTRRFDVAGRELPALSDIDRVIHAAVHAVSSRAPYARLSTTADVLVLTSRHERLAGHVVEQCCEWGIDGLFTQAVEGAYQDAGTAVPPQWAEAIRTRPRSRTTLVDLAYLGPRRRPVLEELAHLRVLPRWADRFRYLTGYFATDDDYATEHGRRGIRQQTRYLASRLHGRDS